MAFDQEARWYCEQDETTLDDLIADARNHLDDLPASEITGNAVLGLEPNETAAISVNSELQNVNQGNGLTTLSESNFDDIGIFSIYTVDKSAEVARIKYLESAPMDRWSMFFPVRPQFPFGDPPLQSIPELQSVIDDPSEPFRSWSEYFSALTKELADHAITSGGDLDGKYESAILPIIFTTEMFSMPPKSTEFIEIIE